MMSAFQVQESGDPAPNMDSHTESQVWTYDH